ncbi:MAG: amidohydrolase family protein, partial [Acidobacteriota bacterium]
KLIAERSSMATTALKASIAKGIDLSLSSGTTTIGDISSTGLVRSAAYNSPIRKVIFEESIALSPNQAQEKVAEVERALETAAADDLFRQGVSPHAPYTASGQLYQGLAALARSRKIPLATHTAETEAEIQFLSTGTGEFRDFLLNMNALPGDWNPPRTSPVSYLHSLGVLKTHCLLIHCNYLDQASIELIAESGNSVVYCPRSHAFFGHGKHPVRRLLDAGIRVALGTDSLASNASLSILDEMRFLAQKRTDLKTEEILKAATVNGANALNLGDETGQLKPGSRADITVLEVPSGMKESKFVEQILEGSGECIGTIIGGNIAWRRKDRT